MNAPLAESVNRAVAKVVAARRVYGDSYVDAHLLPQHELAVASLITNYAKVNPLGSFAGPTYFRFDLSSVLPPSEVTGFRLSNGTIDSSAASVARYAKVYNYLVYVNGGGDVNSWMDSNGVKQTVDRDPDLGNARVLVNNGVNPLTGEGNQRQSQSNLTQLWQQYGYHQFAHPVTGSDVLATAYAGSQQAIQNQLNQVLGNLAAQRDQLKSDLQSKHDALSAQIVSALQTAGISADVVNQLHAYQSQADSALQSGLAGVDTDYQNAVAQAQAQANQQQSVIQQHLTDIVAVQGITTVQTQLSNLLLQPVAQTPVASTPYPSPTFNPPPPPYAIAGFNPAWNTANGYYYTTMYDYATGQQVTAIATQGSAVWINTTTNNAVMGPAAVAPTVSTPATTPAATTPTAATPAPTSTVTSPPPTAAQVANPQYYTDATGTVWQEDPVTGEWTVYSSPSAAPVSQPTATGQQDSSLPADYYMFATNRPAASSASAAPTITGPDGVVWSQKVDGNWYTTDSEGITWTLDASGNVVQAAPAASPTLASSSWGMYGWGFASLAVPQGGSPDIRNARPYDYGFDCDASNCVSCGATGCPASATAIGRINRMPVVPAGSIMGFSQWAALASSLITAVGSIGTAAISATLAPKPKSQPAASSAPAVVVPQSTPSTNYTPWLIGGGIGLLGLMLVLTRRK